MPSWSLETMLRSLHDDVSRALATARTASPHSGTNGDASEGVWLDLLQKYLPIRYHADRAHVVDSQGACSDQIDVVIYDRQYSPFGFHFQKEKIVPAESVYAVFEAKQSINKAAVKYAQAKAESVRRLHRTSLPIPYANGTYRKKTPGHIIAGILTFESDWSPALGDSLRSVLAQGTGNRALDLGCVAAHGTFSCDEQPHYSIDKTDRAATAFLLELIARLQTLATVPMIDIRAYAKWLKT